MRSRNTPLTHLLGRWYGYADWSAGIRGCFLFDLRVVIPAGAHYDRLVFLGPLTLLRIR